MRITKIKLYKITQGNSGERGAHVGESQYWGGGWQTHSLIANTMSLYPQYANIRSLWMGPGQDPYAIEILTDEGVRGLRGELRWGTSRLHGHRPALQPVSDWGRPVQY